MVASSHVVQDKSCCFYDEPTLIFYLSTLYLYVTVINTWEIVLEGVPYEDVTHYSFTVHTLQFHVSVFFNNLNAAPSITSPLHLQLL